jgi:phage shock protein PspC (stress-responsive transcriptional regulator)
MVMRLRWQIVLAIITISWILLHVYVLCTTTELTTVAYEIFALVMTSVILVLQVRSILNEQKRIV